MSNIIQITNIAATVTEDNIKTLFSFVGGIREMLIYFENSQQEETKVAYIVFESNNDAETSLHLHNTVFHDRALIVLPLAESCKAQIPDVAYAKMVRAPEKTVTGIPPKTKNWPSDVISMVVGRTGEQSILTTEPNFVKQGLPNYPKLPFSTEVAKIEEIRRTVLVTNLNPGTSPEQVLDFFQGTLEIKYIRMAGSEHDNAAYVEFSEQNSVAKAFGMMGTDLSGRAVMIQHSGVAISKPMISSLRGNEDGGRRARASKSRSRSRRRKRSRKRSKSRSRRRSRSRKRSRRRSRPRSHRRSRSRPRSQRRSRSHHRRDRKRSGSKTKDRRRKSVTKERKERSRSRHRRSSKEKRPKKESESRHKETRHKSDKENNKSVLTVCKEAVVCTNGNGELRSGSDDVQSDTAASSDHRV